MFILQQHRAKVVVKNEITATQGLGPIRVAM